MNISFVRFGACAAALCVSSTLCAQEEQAAEVVTPVPAKVAAKCFHSLVRFVSANVDVEVRLPRQKDFAQAFEGKFYPQGSAFRVSGDETACAVFEFGEEVVLKTDGAAEFAVAENAGDAVNRTVVPVNGSFTVSLPRTFPTGRFSVAYPHFTAKDLAGESRHELTASGDGEEAVVHVITGILALEGAHYSVARMSAADRVRIRTTHDALFTSMRGEAGDCKVTLDQGVSVYRDPMTGESKTQRRSIEFALTPQRAIKIFRKRSQVGGRMAVSVMTFDSAGEMRNRYTFAEGEASMNFGEEVVRIQDISFKTDKKSDKGDKPRSETGNAAVQSAGGEAEAGSDPSSGSGASENENGSGGGFAF